MTALETREFRPDGTREDLSGRRTVDRGNWNCRVRDLKGGGKAMRRNADGWSLGPIVRLHLNHVIVLRPGGELRHYERIGNHGRIREHQALGVDVFRVADDVAKGDVKERRVIGSGIRNERVFRVGNVLGEAHRVCGFG